jgi:hypothetical protein
MTDRAIRLIVIGAVLVGLLFAVCPMVIVWPWQTDRKIRIPLARAGTRHLAELVFQYHEENGVWPSHEPGLDPWEQPYHLTVSTSPIVRVTAWSEGPDKADNQGAGDDIVSTVPENEGIQQ